MKRVYLLTICFIAFYEMACCQTVTIPFTDEHWNLPAGQVTHETYQGKECILFKAGIIFTKNIDFRDGVIEYDVSFPQTRGFPGIAFRVKDATNFENFYMRPHQSGNPDATQYTPVFNNNPGWQLYHGEGYSKAISFKFDQWHHVKFDIHGIEAEIYIDDMQTPFMKVTELKRGWSSGNFGVIAGGLPVRYTNLKYTPKQPPFESPIAITVPASGTNGLVTRYQVSNQQIRMLFENTLQLTPDIKSKLKWTSQNTESSGTINLARFTQAKDTGDVIVARVVIRSEEEQVKSIIFGFSDDVMVYLNDKLLYAGSDVYRSRDYRYLGTIGFFDALFLPLKKGDNELWFAVAEQGGGWGMKAKFGDMMKISLR